MHDFLGIGLIALGLGLAVAGALKYRARQNTALPAGAIRPEFAMMGEIVRPMVLFVVGLIAFKMSLFYFVFGGARLLTPLTYWGLMFVLAAYTGYLIAATSKRRAVVVERVAEAPSAEAKSAA
jgi:hypothetical protein